MKFVVHNLKLLLDENIHDLKKLASKKTGIGVKDFKSFRIVKESIDARKKPLIYLVYSVLIETEGSLKPRGRSDVSILEESVEEPLIPGNIKIANRPVIIGTGPAGLFAGLVLAQNGYRPLLLERGDCVEKRTEAVNRYWKTGALDEETNVQFGEGGAGTFSDGKLTTRINDRRCAKVLDELYKSGAHEEILVKSKPHIGSDVLKEVVVNLRKRIIDYGGEVRFNSKVTSFILKDGKIKGVKVNGSEEIPGEVVVLAVGHSARDTFVSLYESGVGFIQKPFSIGVRIEHPQQLINLSQYGMEETHPKLGAADYQLFTRLLEGRFIPFACVPEELWLPRLPEKETIVTNGMSEFLRDKENANSALVVSVGPGDFGSDHPLAGIDFQRKWERMAFKVGGGNNCAPVQRLEDFIEGRATTCLGNVRPSYTGAVRLADLNQCLPEFVTGPMKESISYFDSRLKGFGIKDAVLTGVETRTSSPVRIPRDDNFEAIGIKGLYPAGEGAGYAGGIVSAAVDGIRIAEQIIKTYTY